MFAKGQGHCVTLFKVTEILQPVNIFKHLLKPLWPMKAIFYIQSPLVRQMKVCSDGHMIKMAAMPIYGKHSSETFFRTERVWP